MSLSEFRELWFPCPRIRLPELGPGGPVFVEGGRWRFYYTHPAPREFFRAAMPEAVPHLLQPGEMTVETSRQDPAYKVVLGLRCSEGPVRVLHLVGDAPDVTRIAEREEEAPGEGLGWKLKMTHFIAPGSFHGLLRLEDGRLCPITREGGEDVSKSSWVTFSR